MKARHVTSEDSYRTPFGAAPVGSAVTVALDTWEGAASSVDLRLWQEGEGERFLPMSFCETSAPDNSGCSSRRFAATFEPETLGVLWYSFRITAADGAVFWYGARQGWTTGEGCFYGSEPPSFQITVYQPQHRLPKWYTNGVVYQILPDRFARDAQWRARTDAALDTPRKGPRRKLVEQWDTAPHYIREANGDIAQWDFYGGSLEGIREKLDYLQDLGATVLYLNPVFEAASNHRYDTADYLAIDPMLGTREDFTRLCADAEERGISIILDGVFNHAGQDSRYFNAYGNYPDSGAAQGEDSPYRSWFTFNNDGTYRSWWGIADLPEYDENDPALREFFCGENGVVRTWLRAGAKGWRLDVADELPDSFIADIKQAALAERPDALILGEVWEDASNKYAYGQLRHYFQGVELDGVMNYPFRTAVIEYLRGEITAPQAAARLQQLLENYPPESLSCCLNLLGSHDRERILTMLGNGPRNDELSDEQRRGFRMQSDDRAFAVNRLKVAIMLQMTAPGVPSVYYGDEQGMEGYRDPHNRGPMLWEGGDRAVYDLYRAGIALRKSLPLLVEGTFEPVSFGNEVLGWWRCSRTDASEAVCVLVNRSPWDWVSVSVPAASECVNELGRAQAAYIENGQVGLVLKPFECSVLYFHPQVRLQRELEPGRGLIAHITSVPNTAGPGTLGEPAKRFVDWLAQQGYTYWQILPVNPTDIYNSPYAGVSAFAGNPALVAWPEDKAAYLERLSQEPGYAVFCQNEAAWLEPFALFSAIKQQMDEAAWQEWPEPYRSFDSDLANRPELSAATEQVRREQYAFELQWRELRSYAAAAGVCIIGDLPMYVSADSSDVWSHTELFDLNADGDPAGIAGVPPDNLCAEGQIWCNPTYRWDVMQADGYDWWMRRLERMFALYDFVRMDHFLGFSSYYVIREGQTALEGTWNYGPGYEFFQQAAERFGGQLPLIAENLGTITPAVRALCARCGFPGMDVLQFADTDPRLGYRPAPDTLVYLGTHDTATLIGWCQERYGLNRDDAQRTAQELIRRTLDEQKQGVVMMQLQDALGLGDEARMNVPGIAEGNWAWQCQPEDLDTY